MSSSFGFKNYFDSNWPVYHVLDASFKRQSEWIQFQDACSLLYPLMKDLSTYKVSVAAATTREPVESGHWKDWLAASQKIRTKWGEFDESKGPILYAELRTIWIRRAAYLVVVDDLSIFPWKLERLATAQLKLLLGFSPGNCWQMSAQYSVEEFAAAKKENSGVASWDNLTLESLTYGNAGIPQLPDPDFAAFDEVGKLSTLWYRRVSKLPSRQQRASVAQPADPDLSITRVPIDGTNWVRPSPTNAMLDEIDLYYPATVRDTNPADYLELVGSLLYYFPGSFVSDSALAAGNFMEWMRARGWTHGSDTPWDTLYNKKSEKPYNSWSKPLDMDFSLTVKEYLKAYPNSTGASSADYIYEKAAPFRFVMISVWGGCPMTSAFSVSALRALSTPAFMTARNHHGWFSPSLGRGVAHSDMMIYGAMPFLPDFFSSSLFAGDTMQNAASVRAWQYADLGPTSAALLTAYDVFERDLTKIAERAFTRTLSAVSGPSWSIAQNDRVRLGRAAISWRDDAAAGGVPAATTAAKAILQVGLNEWLQKVVDLIGAGGTDADKWIDDFVAATGTQVKLVKESGSKGDSVNIVNAILAATQTIYTAMGNPRGAPSYASGAMPGLFGLILLGAMRYDSDHTQEGTAWSDAKANRDFGEFLGAPVVDGLNFQTKPQGFAATSLKAWENAKLDSMFSDKRSVAHAIWKWKSLPAILAGAKSSLHWNTPLDPDWFGTSGNLLMNRSYWRAPFPGDTWTDDLPKAKGNP